MPQMATETEDISVPSEEVGRLIGKNGQQIRAIRDQSQCNINVDTSIPKLPVVHLKGTAQAIVVAKRLIASVCGGNGIAFLRDVDEAMMETLTSQGWLQQRAAKLGVSTELRNHHLRLTAEEEPEAANQMLQLIQQKLSSEVVQINLDCDTEGWRRVQENAEIQQIELHHNMEMVFSKATGRLTVRGSRQIIERVKETLTDVLSSQSAMGMIHLTARLCENSPPQKLEDLRADIGDAVEHKYGVNVRWSPGATKVVIEGAQHDVIAAKDELEQIFQYFFNRNCAVISVPPPALQTVCGKDDQNLARYQSPELVLTADRERHRLWICGAAHAAEEAYNRLTSSIAQCL